MKQLTTLLILTLSLGLNPSQAQDYQELLQKAHSFYYDNDEDWEGTYQSFQQAIKAQPNNPQTYYELANLLLYQKDANNEKRFFDLCEQGLKAAKNFGPEGQLFTSKLLQLRTDKYYFARKGQQALNDALTLIQMVENYQTEKQDWWEDFHSNALQVYQKTAKIHDQILENYPTAIKTYEQALTFIKKYPNAWKNRWETYEEVQIAVLNNIASIQQNNDLKQYDLAKTTYEITLSLALNFNPEEKDDKIRLLANQYENLGWLYLVKLKQRQAAINAYTQAIELYQSDAKEFAMSLVFAYGQRAGIYADNKQKDQACQDYQNIITALKTGELDIEDYHLQAVKDNCN